MGNKREHELGFPEAVQGVLDAFTPPSQDHQHFREGVRFVLVGREGGREVPGRVCRFTVPWVGRAEAVKVAFAVARLMMCLYGWGEQIGVHVCTSTGSVDLLVDKKGEVHGANETPPERPKEVTGEEENEGVQPFVG